MDCIWKDTCMKLQKLHDMCDNKRTNIGHDNDVFDVIITACSIKNYDRSYNGDKRLYYCPECDCMHRHGSRIGLLHSKYMS